MAAIGDHSRAAWLLLFRLRGAILLLNLITGAVLTAVMIVDDGAPRTCWCRSPKRPPPKLGRHPRPASGGAGDPAVHMLKAMDTVTARVLLTSMVRFFLALGLFDHAAVSALHLLLGVWLSDAVSYVDLRIHLGLATVGTSSAAWPSSR